MTAIKDVLYGWNGQNLRLFHAINGLHGDVYDRLMLLGTELSSRMNFPIYLIVLLAVAIGDRRRNPLSPHRGVLWGHIIAVYVLAFLADCLFLEAAKHFLHYPRPFVILPPESMRVIGPPMDAGEFYVSLPSGHASFAMLLAASLWPALGRAGRTAACFFMAWVCWSRVALGVHFPVDVLAGSLSCLLIVMAARFVVDRILRISRNRL